MGMVQSATQMLQERWPTMLGKLENELATLQTQVSSHADEMKDMEAREVEFAEFVSANEGKNLGPEDVKIQLDPDTHQVLDLFAEELALDEFLVGLDELLAARKINVDAYIREVR